MHFRHLVFCYFWKWGKTAKKRKKKKDMSHLWRFCHSGEYLFVVHSLGSEVGHFDREEREL